MRERYFREQREAERDDGSGLEDINQWFATPRLVIVRLGLQLVTNKLVPSLVEEMLRARLTRPASAKLGTWIVCDASVPWGKGHKTYCETLDELFEQHFERIDLTTPKSVEADLLDLV